MGQRLCKPSNSFLVLSSDDDDDEAANKDLSLKIIEKALLMPAAKLVPDVTVDDDGDAGVLNGTQGAIDGGGNGSSSFVLEGEVVESLSGSSRKEIVPFVSNMKIVKKKKIKKREVQDQSVVVNDKEEEETVEASNMVEPVDPNAIEITGNIVFRKLLGPRYFDHPDSGWGACFNCGEGHTVANCTAAKRKKPCFVCGSLEQNAKQCSKVR
uniref:Uncharacterized protein n=1 Tax=Quercus lobata TaxID=97700 RepID=A0A7N2L0P2_QUELO